MLYFATYFDNNYLSRGLALYNSLVKKSSQDVKLFVLGLDENVCNYFSKNAYKNVEVIPINALENHFPELLSVKDTRSVVEYYFTLSPFLPLYILEKYTIVDRITTLDADILFFGDPIKIFLSYPDASVLITPHNFADESIDDRKFGKYNVSFQSFKNNQQALNVLNDWKRKCLEWCYDYLDEKNNRFADQLYLENWPTDFSGVEEIKIKGAGVAPWNVSKFQLSIDKNKDIRMDGERLIYFHFQHFRISNYFLSFHGLTYFKANPKNKVIKEIYFRYLKALNSELKNNNDKIIKRVPVNKNFIKLLAKDDLYLYTPFLLFSIHPFKYINKLRKWLKSAR